MATAFVVHGLLQLVSNGWRALLHRRHVRLPVLAWYAAGAVLAAGAVAAVRYSPSPATTYLLLGLVPGLVWLPRRALRLDASRPAHALAAGLCVTSVNLVAGVAGPLLDVWWVVTAIGAVYLVQAARLA